MNTRAFKLLATGTVFVLAVAFIMILGSGRHENAQASHSLSTIDRVAIDTNINHRRVAGTVGVL